MATESKHFQLHFVLFPLMAPGHMIPLIDMGKIIAQHGISVTIVTTPVNAARFKQSIDRAVDKGLDLRVVELEFPGKDAGFEQGVENIDMLPSLSIAKNFVLAAYKLKEPMEKLMQQLEPEPSCLISDMGFSWTTQLARKFNIPRIVFHGTSCFSLLCTHNLVSYDVVRTLESENDSLVVPGLPDRIEMTKAQLPVTVKQGVGEMNEMRQKMRIAEQESFGVVVNSFEELEPEYYKRYKQAKEKSVWCVGPVSLCSKDNLDKGDRGNNTAIDCEKCFKWLDSHKAKSVVYACLGSLCDLVASQTMELALGLEASRKPFVLVFRGGCELEKVEKMIDEDGFEERVKGRGLVIRGWAPQVLILSHPAVGAFLTHCGWNSTLEGISSGLPLITWPLFAEQFFNEKFVVQVLRIGVSIRSEIPVGAEGENSNVRKDDITRAVSLMMEDGEEREAMKGRASRLGEIAKKAVEEGGSSDKDMKFLIEEVKLQQRYKRDLSIQKDK